MENKEVNLQIQSNPEDPQNNIELKTENKKEEENPNTVNVDLNLNNEEDIKKDDLNEEEDIKTNIPIKFNDYDINDFDMAPKEKEAQPIIDPKKHIKIITKKKNNPEGNTAPKKEKKKIKTNKVHTHEEINNDQTDTQNKIKNPPKAFVSYNVYNKFNDANKNISINNYQQQMNQFQPQMQQMTPEMIQMLNYQNQMMNQGNMNPYFGRQFYPNNPQMMQNQFMMNPYNVNGFPQNYRHNPQFNPHGRKLFENGQCLNLNPMNNKEYNVKDGTQQYYRNNYSNGY